MSNKRSLKAYDIGVGAGIDTEYLLSKGHEVTAIDKEDASIKKANFNIKNQKNLTLKQCDIKDFQLKNNDLTVAMASLPFLSREVFLRTWTNIYKALNHQGLFVGSIFGDKDEWVSFKNMSFLSNKEFDTLLTKTPYDIDFFDEVMFNGFTQARTKKFWHLYYFILRKV